MLRGSRRDTARSATLLRRDKGASETSATLLRRDKEAEDTAFKRFSGKDFASEDLKGSASRMQSQACLCYAEAQPAFAR